MGARLVVLLLSICVSFFGLHVGSASAASVVHQIVVGDGDVLNAWPGPDGEIGTMDDVVDSNPSPINNSAPNSIGSISYNAFDFGGGVPEATLLPNPSNAVTFLQGTITVDTSVGTSGGGPILTQMNVMGTEPFVGHGAYDAMILSINSGTYDSMTGAFALDVNFVATLMFGTADAIGFPITGTAFYVDLTKPSPSTGNSYVDDSLIPYAQARGAVSLFYLRGSGMVPASTGGTGGSFPSLPIEAGIFALPEPSAPIMHLAALGALASMRWARGRRACGGGRG